MTSEVSFTSMSIAYDSHAQQVIEEVNKAAADVAGAETAAAPAPAAGDSYDEWD